MVKCPGFLLEEISNISVASFFILKCPFSFNIKILWGSHQLDMIYTSPTIKAKRTI